MSLDLHAQLLRPAVIHILRAAGFHSCKPSVLDTLTDLAARHLLLTATNTARAVYDRTCAFADHPASVIPPREDEIPRPLPSIDDEIPTVGDVRRGLAASAFFSSSMTASEEAWSEELRRPLSSVHALARLKERARRDEEDTRDVREFIDWITGPTNDEIRRIAGMTITDTDIAIAGDDPVVKDDYLAALKKKHSKTGDSARYSGTILGRAAVATEGHTIKIEGGPASLQEWRQTLSQSIEAPSPLNGDHSGGSTPSSRGVKRKASEVDAFDEDAPLASRGERAAAMATA